MSAWLHLGLVLAGASLYTLLAYRHLTRGGVHGFEAAAAVRRRLLRNASLIELFLVYSFLLLADRYPLYDALVRTAGPAGAAAAGTAVVLVAYLIGCVTRSEVDRRVRRLEGARLSHLRFHVLLLFLRMGVFVLATPLFFLPVYRLDLPVFAAHNLLGFAGVTLLFFVYVLRGPQLVFAGFGLLGRFPDAELEREVQDVARDRRIPLRRIRVLRTWPSRFAAAFAHFGSSQIFVTDHLTEVVDRNELKAVLYHEVGHLGQLRASLLRVSGSYLVFLVYVYLKAVIDATTTRQIGPTVLVTGFLLFGVSLLLVRSFFGRIIREDEVSADAFSADLIGGRKLYHRAIAKILMANGLSVRFSPSAAEVLPGGGEMDDEIW